MFAERSGRSPQKYCSVIRKLIQLKMNDLFLWFGYTIQLFHLAFVNSSQKDLDTFFLQVFYKILNIGLFLWLVCGCLIAILLTSFWCGYWWSGGGNPHICDFLLFWIFRMFSFCYFQQKHVSFVELVTVASRICASLVFSTSLIYQTPTLEPLKLIKRLRRLLNHSY